MLNWLLSVGALILIAGCSGGGGGGFELPEFLGREGTGETSYSFDAEDPVIPAQIPLRNLYIDRGLYGVIVRVEGLAPTQGYHTGFLLPQNDGAPDGSGIVTFELGALPPAGPQGVGPEQTRIITVATFIPKRALAKVRSVRVIGGPNSRTASVR
jgi:hypothetical protein